MLRQAPPLGALPVRIREPMQAGDGGDDRQAQPKALIAALVALATEETLVDRGPVLPLRPA